MDERVRSIVGGILACLVAAALGGCGQAFGTSAPATTPTTAASEQPVVLIDVTLGIYSGRNDPSWVLTETQATAVSRLIDGLNAVVGTPPQGGLGYHGFTLVVRSAGHADETLVAYRGEVAAPGSGPRSVRLDPGRTVERLLLGTGRDGLTAAEVAAVEADLAASP